MGANDVFLVKDPNLMRGVDYRSLAGTEGISLLIMSCFQSTRAYIQALGRVGRYHEPARRFIWDRLEEPVDKKAEIGKIAELRALKMAKKVIKKAERKRSGKNGPPPPWQVSVASLFSVK